MPTVPRSASIAMRSMSAQPSAASRSLARALGSSEGRRIRPARALEVGLCLSGESQEQAAPVDEPAEVGALSHSGFLCDRLHRDVFGDQAAGRIQQLGAVRTASERSTLAVVRS